MSTNSRFNLGSDKWIEHVFSEGPARSVEGRSRPTQQHFKLDVSKALALRVLDSIPNLLGFKSADTLRKAVKNNTLPLSTFEIPGRKGRFDVTLEVANWLIALRTSITADQTSNLHGEVEHTVCKP